MKRKCIKIIFVIVIVLLLFLVFSVCLVSFKTKNNLCVLSFNVNGGTEINSIGASCGSKIDEPPVPTKDGFEFIGWYIDDKLIDFNKFLLNDNVVATAKWKPCDTTEILVVHFDTAGGNDIDDIEVMKNSLLNPPIAPQKKNYIFEYWMYNDEKFDFSLPITSEITLKAKWKKNTSGNINNSNTCIGDILVDELDRTIYVGEYGYYDSFWNYDINMNNYCYVSFNSSNKAVATISNNGLIKSVNTGNSNISVCINDVSTKKSLKCKKLKLIVIKKDINEDNDDAHVNDVPTDSGEEESENASKEYVDATGIELSNSNIELFHGESVTVSYTLTPSNSYYEAINDLITVKTSTSVIEAVVSKNSIKFIGKSPGGSGPMWFYGSKGQYLGEGYYSVKCKPLKSLSVDMKEVHLPIPSGKPYPRKLVNFSFETDDSNGISHTDWSWSSDNEEVATVENDYGIVTRGVIIAQGAGIANITLKVTNGTNTLYETITVFVE